jgi:hypothetical protein
VDDDFAVAGGTVGLAKTKVKCGDPSISPSAPVGMTRLFAVVGEQAKAGPLQDDKQTINRKGNSKSGSSAFGEG